jgi:Tol biopolymer transport system component
VLRDVGNFWPAGLSASGTLYSIPSAPPRTRLKVISVDFASGQLLSPDAEAVDDSSGFNASADWSRDGKQLVYVSRRATVGGRHSSVLVSRSETGLVRELPLRDVTGLFNPVLSPDGQRVIVVGYLRGGKHGAYVIDLTTGERVTIALAATEERLMGSAMQSSAPSWSVDGRHIYYRRITAGGFGLFEFDAVSGAGREIFSGTDPQGNATVSPDGRTIYYRRLLGPSDKPVGQQDAAFIARDVATGAEREVTRRYSLGAVVLSPDGRHIVTGSRDPSGTSRSMLMISVEDGSTRELLKADFPTGPNPSNPINPLAWAPDSQSVLLARRASVPGQPVEVWWAPVDGREPLLLLTQKTLGRTRIHPDGQRVVFAESESAASSDELMLLENFLPRPGMSAR